MILSHDDWLMLKDKIVQICFLLPLLLSHSLLLVTWSAQLKLSELKEREENKKKGPFTKSVKKYVGTYVEVMEFF